MRVSLFISYALKKSLDPHSPSAYPQIFGDKTSVSELEKCPGCHPSLRSGSRWPDAEILRCAQDDKPYLQMSGLSLRILTFPCIYAIILITQKLCICKY